LEIECKIFYYQKPVNVTFDLVTRNMDHAHQGMERIISENNNLILTKSFSGIEFRKSTDRRTDSQAESSIPPYTLCNWGIETFPQVETLVNCFEGD
jgi:hypothetical protein